MGGARFQTAWKKGRYGAFVDQGGCSVCLQPGRFDHRGQHGHCILLHDVDAHAVIAGELR